MSKCDCKDCPCKKPKTIEERLAEVEKRLDEIALYRPYPTYWYPYWTYPQNPYTVTWSTTSSG